MAINGPSVYVHDRAFGEEDRSNVFHYFMPVSLKFEPEQEIKYQSITLPNAKLLAFALEHTQRQIANIQFGELDQTSALTLLFAVYKNANLKTKQLTLGKHFSVLENVDSGDVEIKYTNFLKINVKALAQAEAEKLISLINSGEFSSVEIAIEEIHEGSTLTLLGVIGQNPHIEHIDIKIPRYNVNNLGALRAFLAKPLMQPADDIASLSEFFQKISLDLNEFRATAQSTFESVRQQSATLLNSYVVAPLRFLVEEDNVEAGIDADPQLAAASTGRQSPRSSQ